MKISILTPDSKIPNLAAMKISSYHGKLGDEVILNFPLMQSDLTYASVLFSWTLDPNADLVGGSKYPTVTLPPEIEISMPDYSLYPKIDYSMGYTYKACPRTCDFCIVPKQKLGDKHYSIWDFHESRFNKIMLMNNNTFADPFWRDTFEEIIDAHLTVMDQNGFDARLITEEHASWLKRLRFQGQIHTAWDYVEHEVEVLRGLNELKKARVYPVTVYILIGHTTHEENLHRVMTVENMGYDAFVMPLNRSDPYQRAFARWCNHKAVFKSVHWEEYRGGWKISYFDELQMPL